jgi:ankyrin repeat protein
MTRKRHSNTNEWILHRQELSSWTQKEEIQILWIHGDPGCGKSYLYGKILDYLELFDKPLLFFLFCDGDGERRTIDSLIRSWIYQMIENFPDAAQKAIDFQKANGQSSATTSETMSLFRCLLENSPACYLTVDGLDECPDRDQFFNLLGQLPKRFKILIFSRLYPDIKAAISQHSERHVALEILPDAVKADIDSYINERLQSEYAFFDISVVDKIRQRLLNCHGMFLWVHLMFDQLEAQTNVAEILQCLDEMPDGLNEFYRRIFERINRLRKPRRDLAHKVFFWIRVARRPLSVEELTSLIAMRIGDEALNKMRFLHDPENVMSSVCSPLVQFRHPGGLAFTRHFSVNQYLDTYFKENQIFQEIEACYNAKGLSCGESLAAAVCLTYLSMPVMASIAIPRHANEEAYCKLRSRCPQVICPSDYDQRTVALHDYASNFWFEHLRQITTLGPKLQDIAMEFINIKVLNRQSWWLTYATYYDRGWHSAVMNVSALHIMAYLRLANLIMIQTKDADLSLRDSNGECPLLWAVRIGDPAVVRILLDAGFDPYSETPSLTTVLHSAAYYGPLEVFDEIISRAHHSNEVIVDGTGYTALHRAAESDRIDIIERILRANSVVYGTIASLDSWGRSPLQLSYKRTTLQTFVNALDKNVPCAVFDIRDHNHNTVLHRAAAWGDQDMVRKLIAAGANIHSMTPKGTTPLHKAARAGCPDIVKILLEYGANVNLCNYKGKTALIIAARRGHTDTIMMLVEAGADVNLLHKDILSISFEMNQMKSTEIFPRENANITIDGGGRTALHVAAGYGHQDIVKMLLGFGADINLHTKNGDTALHHAAYRRQQKIVELLLGAGANVNIPGRKGQTVLFTAILNNDIDIVKILLRTNIDLAHVDHQGYSALYCANVEGNYEIVKLLHARMEELGLTSPENSVKSNIEDSDFDSSRETSKTFMNDSYVLIDTSKEFGSGTKDPVMAVHEIPLEDMLSSSLNVV